MNPKKEISLSVPWWSIIRGSFVAGAQFTFLGSFGIVGLTITHGWEALGVLLYLPGAIAFFGSLILLCISVVICTYSYQWARRVVCLLAYVFATIVFGPVILLPHFVLGIFLIVGVSQSMARQWDGGIFALILCSVLLLIPTIYWSRALSRFAKESKWLSKIWGFANKYVKNNRGAKKRLKKLIDELSTPPPLIPERIKNIFRRS
jgi:hypothetical protein